MAVASLVQSPADVTALSAAERNDLSTHEATIARGLQTFYDVGAALSVIREDRLYREEYATFEDYCQRRWGMVASRARQLIGAAGVIANLQSVTNVTPQSESQARELAPLRGEVQQAAWQAAVETAPEGKVTASHIRDVVDAAQSVGLKQCAVDSRHIWMADLPQCPYCTMTPEQRVEGLKESIKRAHVANNSGNNEWYTPDQYLVAARKVLGTIDLDPASSETANKVVKAKQFYDADDDGLQREWNGTVWMNPPYAQPLVAHFCAKLVDSLEDKTITAAIVLVNNATETAWFREVADVASAICFPTGRVRFWSPDKESAAPLQGQALLYIGPKSQTFISVFSQFGVCWRKG